MLISSKIRFKYRKRFLSSVKSFKTFSHVLKTYENGVSKTNITWYNILLLKIDLLFYNSEMQKVLLEYIVFRFKFVIK